MHAIISTGGTGIAKRDTTMEVVERLLSRKLDGFGELFRMLSWDQVGSSAMLSPSMLERPVVPPLDTALARDRIRSAEMPVPATVMTRLPIDVSETT